MAQLLTVPRPILLYLDTFHLSALLKNPSGTEATRVRELCESGKYFLVVSLAHIYELSALPRFRQNWLSLLGEMPGVVVPIASTRDILRAEAKGTTPQLTEFYELRYSIHQLKTVNFLRILPIKMLAPLIRYILSSTYGAHCQCPESDSQSPNRIICKLQQVLLYSEWVAAQLDRCKASLQKLAAKPLRTHSIGLTDPVYLRESAVLPRLRNATSIAPEMATTQPAVCLRAAVSKTMDSLNNAKRVSTVLDLEHLTYAAYADFATVDKAIFDATKPYHKHLRVQLYGPEGLSSLLDVATSAIQ